MADKPQESATAVDSRLGWLYDNSTEAQEERRHVVGFFATLLEIERDVRDAETQRPAQAS